MGTLIIKTNLLHRIGNALSLAHLDSFDGKDFYFTCNCGNEFTMRKDNDFISDNQYACFNCKRKSRLAPFVGERYIFKRVKSDAHTAGRPFELDFDWFVEAIHLPCFYCGRRDTNSSTVPSQRAGESLILHFRYNGLDRIRNDIGYTKDNCVPSCFVCNRAKNSLPLGEFLEWIETMVRYRGELVENARTRINRVL